MNRNKNLFISFFAFFLFIFFILPPFFAEQNTFSSSYKISDVILYTLFSVFLYFFCEKCKNITKINIKKAILLTFIGLLLLFFVAFIFSFFTRNNQKNFEIPEDLFSGIILIWGTFVFAFFEELLYRFFFADIFAPVITQKLSNEKQKKIATFFLELCIILIFAFSHKYLNFWAVANAFFCGIVLRILKIKSKTIWTSTFAHFFYNLVVIFS